ncbi:MAG: hypothetical protein IPO81_30980 [Kouleothrix sp.]|nr:hypothetical protein [Kouleothrix sp.]
MGQGADKGGCVPQEADRASQEADRASQEADRASQEADRASQEADRASQEADRASQEAIGASQEADRASRQAIGASRQVGGLFGHRWGDHRRCVIGPPMHGMVQSSVTVHCPKGQRRDISRPYSVMSKSLELNHTHSIDTYAVASKHSAAIL